MIGTIGVIFLLLGIVAAVMWNINEANIKQNAETGTNYEKIYDLPIFFKKYLLIIGIGVLIIVFAVANPFSNNNAGNRQIIQTIDGNLKVRFQPGLYFSGFWSTVTTYPNNFTIQVSRKENKSPDADLWVKSDAKDGTFSEGDNAELEHTVKWDLPNSDSLMLSLHITYNNVENLMSTTLLSYQKKMASFSTQRMSLYTGDLV